MTICFCFIKQICNVFVLERQELTKVNVMNLFHLKFFHSTFQKHKYQKDVDEGSQETLYRSQLDSFQFLEDLSCPIQEASSVLTNWREVGRLLNSVWECPYSVVKDMCELLCPKTKYQKTKSKSISNTDFVIHPL